MGENEQIPDATGLSRRGLIGLAVGAGAAGLAIGAGSGVAGGVALGRARERQVQDAAVSGDGIHQSGITTPVQDHLHFPFWTMLQLPSPKKRKAGNAICLGELFLVVDGPFQEPVPVRCFPFWEQGFFPLSLSFSLQLLVLLFTVCFNPNCRIKTFFLKYENSNAPFWFDPIDRM